MLAFLLALACAPPPPDPADFDTTCDAPEDCVVVYTDVSSCSCSCDVAALSVEGAAAWDEAVADYHARERESCLIACAPCPTPPDATCDAGSCSLAE